VGVGTEELARSLQNFLRLPVKNTRKIRPLSGLPRFSWLVLTLITMLVAATDVLATDHGMQPNIVLILADDMGYGDIKAYNPAGKIPTPNLDTLAQAGMRFTDAHSPSAVCTPTRYALLTGRYAWRSELKRGVLWGHSPLLIEPDRETIASMLKRAGYKTAALGKWHLGLGNNEANFYDRLVPGPNALGFDYFYGIPASLDMAPYVFVENEGLATPLEGKVIEASAHRREDGGGFYRTGAIGTGFSHQQVLPQLADKAVSYIKTEGASGDGSPFFLYFALPAPHTPWLPDEQHRGISGAGYYGDFVAQVDTVVGQVTKALEEAGVADNTLLVYSSDNGAHWFEEDTRNYGHAANGNLRGQKADIHEGGHRVPLLVRWPGQVTGGAVSVVPVVLTDLMATFASVATANLEKGAGPDGVDISPLMLSNDASSLENRAIIHHALDGMFAIRVGDWKLIEGLGSGGFSKPAREDPAGQATPYQLYNLADDPSEKNNVASENADVVATLLAELERIRNSETTEGQLCFTCQFEQKTKG
jgi:arylsulfatase A-like enzyme